MLGFNLVKYILSNKLKGFFNTKISSAFGYDEVTGITRILLHKQL